jgi:cerevisin
MSLGGPASTAVDTAVKNGIDKGIHFTIAAGRNPCYRHQCLSDVVVGNSNEPAEGTSPAEVQEAVTVGAVDSQNVKACFSNYGPILDGESPPSSLGQHIY